jgi:hypothetical protein
MTNGVECLHSKLKVLSSTPSTIKNKMGLEKVAQW